MRGERDANLPIKLISEKKSTEGSRERVDHPRSKEEIASRINANVPRASTSVTCFLIVDDIVHQFSFNYYIRERECKESNN